MSGYRLHNEFAVSDEAELWRECARDGSLPTFAEDTVEIVSAFHSSPEFLALTPRERALSQYTVKCVTEGMPWRLLEGNDTDNLVAVPSPLYTAESVPQDALVLSGALGWDWRMCLESEYSPLSNHLANMALNDYVALGLMIAVNKQRGIIDNGLAYSVNNGAELTETTIGGTFHGDFCVSSVRYVMDGKVIDPAGVRREFSPPIETQVVRAYHSVEQSVAKSMLTHLIRKSPESLEGVKAVILRNMEAANIGRPGGNFADFGDGTRNDTMGLSIHGGDLLYSTIVDPDNHDITMQIISKPTGVELRNIDKRQPDELLSSIIVVDAEIPTFIATMAAANGGRTAFEDIYAAIQAAHITDMETPHP